MNIRRLIPFSCVAILLLLGVQHASAFCNPGTGRWLSKDPSAETGGANLYGYVDNRPTVYFDPFGLCPFIAVSGSQVFGPTNHATLSYFTGSAEPKVNKTYSVAELIAQGAKVKASVELERSPEYNNRAAQDWKVWAEVRESASYTSPIPSQPIWLVDRVGISYVLYASGYGTGNIAAVYVDGDNKRVIKKWESMIASAKTYRWASQNPNTPDNFPNSIYSDPTLVGVPGNNSNTFARYILDRAGLNSDLHNLLGGFFPGNDTPADVPNVWSGTPVRWNAVLSPHP